MFSETESVFDQLFIPDELFHLPFYQLLPDRFHSSRESLASVSILLLPTLLNDRRRSASRIMPIVPQLITSIILHLDSAISTVRECSRKALIAMVHVKLAKGDCNQGARILLAQFENRGQLTQSISSSSLSNSSSSTLSSPEIMDSGFSSVSSPPLYESDHTSSLNMLQYLTTVRRFWPRELASSTFMPETLQSTAQLSSLVDSLLTMFGNSIKEQLAELTITAAQGPNQLITCRALALYRALGIPITEKTVIRLTQKLSEIVSDPHEERQAAMLEIISTFISGVDKLKEKEQKVETKETITMKSGPKHHKRQASGHRRSGSMYGSELASVQRMDAKTDELQTKAKVDSVCKTIEQPGIDTNTQVGIFAPLIRVACALLHSDYDHEYRSGLNIISHINQIIPLYTIITTVEKQSNSNPALSMQECFWRGLVADQDQSDKKLGERVFGVLVETLGSAEHLATNGLAIQLAALLPRLSEQYDKDTERESARKAAQTIQEWRRANTGGFERQLQAAEHLEMILSLYANADYKQGASNWLGAVCKYLHEFDPEACDAQLRLFSMLLESRDTPPWLLSQSAASIRALLQHCSPEHYPPTSLPEVVRSLSQLIHHTKHYPLVFENALTALQSIVGRAAILYAPTARSNQATVTSASSTIRPVSPLSNLLPGRVLEFEVDYDHRETERKQIIHWKRTSTGRVVRKRLRAILQSKTTTTSSSSSTGQEKLRQRVGSTSAINEEKPKDIDESKNLDEKSVPDEMKHFDFLYYDSINSAMDERDYLYDIELDEHDKFRMDSAHDTEKEDKDDIEPSKGF